MYVHMRNKLTGEFRDVEPDTQEFYDLRAQVTPSGQTMWEQTNVAHAEAVKERAATGDLLEEDLGHEAQDELRPEALRLSDEGVAPEQNPHLTLTPGEIEAGLTPRQKLEDLEAQFEERVLGKRRQIFSQAADAIADERREPQAQQEAQGQLARAGGSDDRDNVPRPDASQQSGSGTGSPATAGSAKSAPSPQSTPGGGDQ